MLKIIANITLKCIKYLQKHRIELLQDKEGNIINISINQEMIKAWQEKPIEVKIRGKETLLYKNKIWYLEVTK